MHGHKHTNLAIADIRSCTNFIILFKSDNRCVSMLLTKAPKAIRFEVEKLQLVLSTVDSGHFLSV